MQKFSVKAVSSLAGVTVRTLHLYDEMGLLLPSMRTDAGYRYYEEKDLYRLQQILFYKELGISLKDIADILDNPEFDLIKALESHRSALQSKELKIQAMLQTIEKTISTLKGKRTMESYNELYMGLSKEEIREFQSGALEKYGTEAVNTSENYLRQLSKEQIQALKSEASDVIERLISLMTKAPDDPLVQKYIARHYQVIRKFWGTANMVDPQWEAYRGLGELYVSDPRFTQVDGRPNAEFARFMRDAMRCFVEEKSV